jgi:hypothetical protein
MGLTGRLTIRKNTDVPTCIAIFCIHHYTSLNTEYFSLEYWSQRLKLFKPHLYTLESVPLSVLPLLCTRSDPPFHIQFESILPFTYVREPDCEQLVVCMSWSHLVTHTHTHTHTHTPPEKWVQTACPQILYHERNL